MSALLLRIIACTAMLLDHIGFCWGIEIFRLIGRIAFPIYVFLICNGYKHTSSKMRYALRLAVFAVLSQIPYALFVSGRLSYETGNVFFTLLAALLAIWSVDVMRRHKILRWLSLIPSLLICIVFHFNIIQVSYGAIGILMALTFYYCDRKTLTGKVLIGLGMVVSVYYSVILAVILQQDPELTLWKQQQIFSLGALIPIFLYNEKKGTLPKAMPPKVVQYGFYAFYPLHLLVLWLLRLIG